VFEIKLDILILLFSFNIAITAKIIDEYFIRCIANTNLDWTGTGVATIPDSLPSVHSSEDWQAAFGFQTESSRTNHIIPKSSPSDSPRVTFNENFVDTDVYINVPYTTTLTESSGTFTPSLLVNSPASKFMADFQQQRLNIQVSKKIT